jgi:hypothetical protein
MNAEAAVKTSKGIGRIVGAGFKSPMDFSLNVAKGFHNLPKLYGGEVRRVDKVTDLETGMRTAVKVSLLALWTALSNDSIRNLVSDSTMVLPALSQTLTKAPKRKAVWALSRASAGVSLVCLQKS